MVNIKLFGDFSTDRKENERSPSLKRMAREKFDNPLLLAEIDRYLDMRIQMNDRPTKISFKAQLDLLESYPPEERVEQIEKSILGGYRSLCYPRKNKVVDINTFVKRKKEKEKIIMTRGF